MYDAILFDLDGTLIDTERLAIETGAEALAALGLTQHNDLLHSLIGLDQTQAGLIIGERLPEIDLEAFRSEWHQRFGVAMASGVPLKPGAEALVHDLSRNHCLGLVTSSQRETATDKLTRSGLITAFRTVVAREDVTMPKPAPEPYLLAANRLGAQPGNCLVFEDSEPGAKAAWAAGMRVVQVQDIHHPSGRFSHHIAADLMSGAAWAGILIQS